MTTISLVSLSPTVPILRPRTRLFSRKTHLLNPILSPFISSNLTSSKGIRDRIVAFERKSSDQNDSQFKDEDGVVDDMDGYLNYLSLEYDSVWDTKPSWCQPWTIGLTGVLAIALSWLVLQSVFVTTLVSLLISAWWYIFLYSYPKAYADMIAERRRKVTTGAEDTFGLSKSQ